MWCFFLLEIGKIWNHSIDHAGTDRGMVNTDKDILAEES